MLKLKIIKLRNISFSNKDFEILKAAMLASKSTMLKGDDPKKWPVKCHLEEETMQRRMNGIFTSEGD